MKLTRWLLPGLLVLVSATPALSQRPSSAPPGTAPTMTMKALELTPEQRSRMRELHFQAARKAIELRGRVAQASVELRRLMSSPQLDADAIRSAASELAEARGVLFRHGVETRVASLSMLTEEQRGQMRQGSMGPHIRRIIRMRGPGGTGKAGHGPRMGMFQGNDGPMLGEGEDGGEGADLGLMEMGSHEMMWLESPDESPGDPFDSPGEPE